MMKSIQFLTVVMISLSGLTQIVSCTNSDSTLPQPEVIENNVQSGDWRISSFVDSGKDETSHFQGFLFTFQSQGVLTASNGIQTHIGTWSVTQSNSQDDTPGDIDFNIQFNSPQVFAELNEDWHLISQSSNRIELIHISGGNGGTDYLTFEKI